MHIERRQVQRTEQIKTYTKERRKGGKKDEYADRKTKKMQERHEKYKSKRLTMRKTRHENTEGERKRTVQMAEVLTRKKIRRKRKK